MSYQNNAEYVSLQNGLFLARLTQVYTLTDSDVNGSGNFTGMAKGTNIYSFLEQTKDPTTGLPIDAPSSRGSLPVPPAVPTSAFAIETNNTLLTVPGTIPTGYTNPGPYVWMRERETVGSVPVYEYEVSGTETWGVVQIYGTTPYVVEDLTGTNLAYVWPCSVLAGSGKGSFGWAIANFLLPQMTTPNAGQSYFGYTAGTSTLMPPNETNSNVTSWPGYQLIWETPFNYVTLQGQGSQQWGLLSSSSLILGGVNILLGQPNYTTVPALTPPMASNSYTNLGIQYGAGSYSGATGTDGDGNMFVAGLCANVGGGSSSVEPSLW